MQDAMRSCVLLARRGVIYGAEYSSKMTRSAAPMIISRRLRPLGASARVGRVCAVAHGARRGAGALGGARDREARHVQALPRAHAARLPDF